MRISRCIIGGNRPRRGALAGPFHQHHMEVSMSDSTDSTTKSCSRCGLHLPLDDGFYRDRRASDGRDSACKTCKKSSTQRWSAMHRRQNLSKVARWRSANPERARAISCKAARRQRLRNPERIKARQAVTRAIRDGRLVVAPCACCDLKPSLSGRQRIQAHHHNGYSPDHWLDIVWLCSTCHRARRGS